MTRVVFAKCALSLGSVAILTVLLGAGLVSRAPDVRTVDMHDACDDVSFNSAFGEGICIDGLGGGITVETFLRVLTNSQTMGAWHFAPGSVRLKSGQAVQAYNSGGEVHTFTEVQEFGGGFIPELNELTGDVVPAPECLDIPALEFIPAGGTGTPAVKSPGTYHYECCIHPWMRATVTVR